MQNHWFVCTDKTNPGRNPYSNARKTTMKTRRTQWKIPSRLDSITISTLRYNKIKKNLAILEIHWRRTWLIQLQFLIPHQNPNYNERSDSLEKITATLLNQMKSLQISIKHVAFTLWPKHMLHRLRCNSQKKWLATINEDIQRSENLIKLLTEQKTQTTATSVWAQEVSKRLFLGNTKLPLPKRKSAIPSIQSQGPTTACQRSLTLLELSQTPKTCQLPIKADLLGRWMQPKT